MKKKRIANATAPMRSSESLGYRSFLSLTASAASRNLAVKASIAPPSRDDERQHEPEERQRLDQPDPDEHRAANHPGCLGLPGHGLDRLAHEDADPDPRSDGREPVYQASADRRSERGGGEPPEVREQFDHSFPPWSMLRRHRTRDVRGGEHGEDERLQYRDEDLEPE